ncbi:hypothetical protein QQ054_17960 [Oscillatoria amoena NRMC-F 0135]|nr:hypothetical protein [Oscillatoria amoena NRMC-F 0135]
MLKINLYIRDFTESSLYPKESFSKMAIALTVDLPQPEEGASLSAECKVLSAEWVSEC